MFGRQLDAASESPALTLHAVQAGVRGVLDLAPAAQRHAVLLDREVDVPGTHTRELGSEDVVVERFVEIDRRIGTGATCRSRACAVEDLVHLASELLEGRVGIARPRAREPTLGHGLPSSFAYGPCDTHPGTRLRNESQMFAPRGVSTRRLAACVSGLRPQRRAEHQPGGCQSWRRGPAPLADSISSGGLTPPVSCIEMASAGESAARSDRRRLRASG
jgi:hypothetical protein